MSTPSVEFFSVERRQNPYPFYAELRDFAPVYRVPGSDLHLVSRFEDVSTVLTQPERFSSKAMQRMMLAGISSDFVTAVESSGGPDPELMKALGPLIDMLGFDPVELMNTPSVIASDPPNHGRLRHIVNRGFTPRRIAALEPRIRQIAADAAERMLERDEFDLVSDFTVPLPVTVIAELLGIDPERREDFKRWSDTLIQGMTGSASGQNPGLILGMLREFNGYMMEQVERRRRDPQDDLISRLVAAEEGEAALTPVETMMFTILLLVAGNETTTNLMGSATLALLESPEQWTRVQARPELIPAMVEEALRYDGPIQALFRETTEDVELAGTKLPQGTIVMPLFASANRDAARFPDPDRFDIDRDTRGHLAFGFGIHFCLGASLARLEAKVGFEELFKRVAKLERLDTDLDYVDSFLLRGLRGLRLSAERS